MGLHEVGDGWRHRLRPGRGHDEHRDRGRGARGHRAHGLPPVTPAREEALEEAELLKIDYVEALDKFRRVSKLKKEIDKRPRIRRAATPAGMPARSGGAAAAAKPARVRPNAAPVKHVALPVTAQQLSMEEAKLRRVEESIRIFVRVADPKFRQVVPMRFFNLNLTAA